MSFDVFLDAVSELGEFAKSGNEVISLLNNIKKLLKNDASGGANAVGGGVQAGYNGTTMGGYNYQTNSWYGQGNQWMQNLQAVAAQNGNSWVPTQTQAFLGVNLTGVWVIPTIYNYQVYFRQYGPYLNIVGVYGGMAVVFAEGLFDPTHNIIHLIGQNTYYGVSFETRGQLFPNWTIHGEMSWMNQFGQPMQMPYVMQKVG